MEILVLPSNVLEDPTTSTSFPLVESFGSASESSSVEGHRALCSPQRDVYFGVGVLTRMLDLAIKSKSVSKALEREYLEMTRAAESTLDQRFLSHLDDNDNEFLSRKSSNPKVLRSIDHSEGDHGLHGDVRNVPVRKYDLMVTLFPR
ncbi:hypothetical protein HZH68_015298 [Vespula germanica]|uniref:Uncharacterized protein n=1 Tax=Vespula germanica TaxID=30212 RepID=A0A834J8I9_VESGE|nr:hypothetical protein HZH68_015298 [Vespula germanica]